MKGKYNTISHLHQKGSEFMGILLAVVCATAYSFNYVFIQLGMRKSPDDNGSFTSLFMCVLTVLFIMLFFGQKESDSFDLYGLLFYIIAGFCTAFLGRNILFSSIRKIGSSRAAALKNSAPVFTIVFAVLFLGESISPIAGTGILIIFCFLFLQARYDIGKIISNIEHTEKLGFLLAVTAALCFGFGQGFRKLGVLYYSDAIVGSLIGSTFALVVYILMEITKKRLKATLVRNITTINYFFIAAGVATGIAQVSFFVALLYTKVSYISTITAIEPVITVILASILLKEEQISKRIILTAFGVFIGTLIIIVGNR
jgi:drug/metabolite transporter (DMT)-like permease